MNELSSGESRMGRRYQALYECPHHVAKLREKITLLLDPSTYVT